MRKKLTINIHIILAARRTLVVAIAAALGRVRLVLLLDHRLEGVVAVLERLILIVEQRVDALRAHLLEERVPLHLLALGQVEVYIRGVVDGPAIFFLLKKR